MLQVPAPVLVEKTHETKYYVTYFPDGSNFKYLVDKWPYSTTFRLNLMESEIKACWKVEVIISESVLIINSQVGCCCGSLFLQQSVQETTLAQFALSGNRLSSFEKLFFTKSDIMEYIHTVTQNVYGAPDVDSATSQYNPLRKMTRSEILDLRPNDDQYYIVLTRLYEPDPKVIFEGMSNLYVERVVLKKTVDRLSIISPYPIDWAEYSRDSIEADGTCIAEDYKMEIFVPRESN